MAKNNALNSASQDLTLDPGASGDSFVQLAINGSDKFRIGVDDTDDSFRISLGSALGTTDTFIMTPNGESTKPLQASFLAFVSADDTNVTGDGTVATVICDSEVFDQNSDYNTGTGIFTSPVTGKYVLNSEIKCEGLTSSETTGELRIVTSNNTFIGSIQGYLGKDVNNDLGLGYELICDMDASDTAKVDIVWSNGSKVIDIGGDATELQSYFSGYLAC